jgi:hypothetical protein
MDERNAPFTTDADAAIAARRDDAVASASRRC